VFGKERINHLLQIRTISKMGNTKNLFKKALSIILFAISTMLWSQTTKSEDYVNTYMGNISHLLVPTFPIIHLPNGMLLVYPER